jgi:acyl transferase domain-containing protein
MTSAVPRTGLEVAIIGMAGRFPGAKNVDEFWRNLRNGVESISFFSEQELEEAGVDPASMRAPNYVRAGAMLGDADLFDAAFFGFTPREAEILDPQHRVFLECAWASLEDAGCVPETDPGLIGIYAGVGTNTYFLMNLASNRELLENVGGFQAAISNDKDFITSRVAYKLGLTGPSVTVQTACSTSLVAVHLACQALLNGECDIALAGGVSVVAGKRGYLYESGGIFSPDGHCRSFDAQARGTVGGSGVGIVVLKLLNKALQDGDVIQAVIKGSAVNNDGSQRVGFTAPAVKGQASVIRAALEMAEVEPESISYVEAHGTATPLGDPVEVAALTQAFRARTSRRGFCALGSVKSNVGHLDTAAGVAGLIKTVLAMKHREIPPQLHFQRPNPAIDFAASPFYVNDTLAEWVTDGRPRRAGISSFGLGGVNAHVIVEEFMIAARQTQAPPSHQLLTLSAKNNDALAMMAANLAGHLRANESLDLADVAFTLQACRKAFPSRQCLVASEPHEAAELLETLDPGRVFVADAATTPVAFMFPGGGAQYPNMGLETYRTQTVYREEVDLCASLLRPLLGLDLHDLLYPDENELEEARHQLTQTHLALPALFVTEYALARLWISWGIHPSALIGHSLGEYVAACLAGVFTLPDALALTVRRARLLGGAAGTGKMLGVVLPEANLARWLNGDLSCAAVNGPSHCVLSGPEHAIEDVARRLSEQGIQIHHLQIDVAAHSQLAEPIVPTFTEFVATFNLSPPRIPFLSNVTGTWISADEAMNPGYWGRHLRQTVRFADGVRELLIASPECLLLEVGPGQTLTSLARQQGHRSQPGSELSSMRHPQDPQSDSATLLTTLGRLWIKGVPVDWPAFWEKRPHRRVALPTYPFQRQRYWIESATPRDGRASVLPRRNIDVAEFFYIPSWTRTMPPPLSRGETRAEKPRRWLLFVDQAGLGTHLAAALRERGEDVVTVEAGTRGHQRDADSYVLDPRDGDQYKELISRLHARSRVPETIVHLWGVSGNDHSDDGSFFQEARNMGYDSLLFLAKALDTVVRAAAVRLEVVATQLAEVIDTDDITPEKAVWLGPCKVIPQEYPSLSCRCVDVVLSGHNPCALISQLMAEFLADQSDPFVAYRGRQRWIQTFEQVRIDAAARRGRDFRHHGVYLITGGLGRIGRLLSRHLAESVQARLVLIGRTELPPRNFWDDWLRDHDEEDEVSIRIHAVRSLEQLGSEVLLIAADVGDKNEMGMAVDRALGQFGAIHGIIHAAGTTVGPSIRCPIQEIEPEHSTSQFQPKVDGLYAMEQALRGRELDFCLLFSSNASVLGGLGFAAYSAANAFMDAFAAHRGRRSTTAWISATWDGWPGAADSAVRSSIDQFALSRSEALDAFERVVRSATVCHVVVSAGNLRDRSNIWLRRPATPNSEQMPLHPRPLLCNEYLPPSNEAERHIAGIWSALLGIEQVGRLDNFFELGGHSLLATQVISRLRDTFHVDLPLRRMFEAPTVAELARAVSDALQEVADVTGLEQIVSEIEAVAEDDAVAGPGHGEGRPHA